MAELKDLCSTLDTEINRVYAEYSSLHEELNKHRGKPIEETNLNEVNRLLKDIQTKFAELYPALYFITYRHEFATNAINSYNDFIDLLKKAGAHNEPQPEA